MTNLTEHRSAISEDERARFLGQHGLALWMTGLSGSGKSTIAHAASESLVRQGRTSYVLDGDNLRLGLNADLGFSPDDRRENIRRVSEVARLFAEAGVITFVAFISPYREDRAAARRIIGEQRFREIFVDTPLETCEERDPKGLYRRARAGEILEFTGVSAPYEAPESPDLLLQTGSISVEGAVGRLLELVRSAG